MKRLACFPIFLLMASAGARAQHYYNDILSKQQTHEELSLYKKHKIRGVNLKSYDEDGSPSKGFFCKKSVSKDFRRVEMGSRSGITSPSLFISEFDEKGNLVSSVDSSEISVTRIRYDRDAAGKLVNVFSLVRSRDDDYVTEITESHIYQYDGNGAPEKMIQIKNGRDTSIILFVKDAAGNISIEKNSRTGKTYYYYFDEKNRLTDLVKENELTGKLLPDYMFEYDEAGRLTKMLNTEEGSSGNYFYWIYSYDGKGLKTEEKIYSKEKTLLGRIEYSYK